MALPSAAQSSRTCDQKAKGSNRLQDNSKMDIVYTIFSIKLITFLLCLNIELWRVTIGVPSKINFHIKFSAIFGDVTLSNVRCD